MATEESQYPILVDTDALIAVGNSSLWDCITENIGLTTTNVCQQELKRHYEQNRSHAQKEVARIAFTTVVRVFLMRLRIQRHR